MTGLGTQSILKRIYVVFLYKIVVTYWNYCIKNIDIVFVLNIDPGVCDEFDKIDQNIGRYIFSILLYPRESDPFCRT